MPDTSPDLYGYLVGGGGGGAVIGILLFKIYQAVTGRINGNKSGNPGKGDIEIIGVKIGAMSKVIETKMDLMIDEQKDTRTLLGKVFEKILEK